MSTGNKQWLESPTDLSLNSVSSTFLWHEPGKGISPLSLSFSFYRQTN